MPFFHTPSNIAGVLRAMACVGLVGCVEVDVTNEEAQLLVPDRVSVEWDASFNGVTDGLGALVPVDLMVYEGGSGEPMSDVALGLVPSPGLDVIEHLAVEILDNDCLDCVWDSGRDRYIDWDRTTDSVQTDEDGLARVYLWVDAFSDDQTLAVDVEMDAIGSLIEVVQD